MKIENVQAGTKEWLALREHYYCASEASAMMNQSNYMGRQELLRIYAGVGTKEFSDFVQKRILDKGHEIEEKARSIICAQIGQELYPVICTNTFDDLPLLASMDGLTMDESIGWEAKSRNKDLVISVENDDLDPHYYWQLEQQLLITNAEHILFTVSDGTPENTLSMEYRSLPERRIALIAGWKQFRIDLANYQHVEVKAAVTGAPVDSLPAIIYTMDKTDLSITSNFDVYKAKAEALTERAKTPLVTDQDFADRDLLGKKFRESEKMLKVKAADVVGQVVDVAAFSKSLLDLAEVHRVFAVDCENAVKAEKENRRADIIKRGKDALTKHIDTLNTMIGKPYMPAVASDFPGAIKGKSNLLKIQDAADAELARCTIITDAFAKNIQINLNTLRDMANDYKTLFADAATIVLKNNDDLVALVKVRIDEHKAEVKAKEERERIEAEMKAAKLAAVASVVQPVQPVQEVNRAVVLPPATDLCAPDTVLLSFTYHQFCEIAAQVDKKCGKVNGPGSEWLNTFFDKLSHK